MTILCVWQECSRNLLWIIFSCTPFPRPLVRASSNNSSTIEFGAGGGGIAPSAIPPICRSVKATPGLTITRSWSTILITTVEVLAGKNPALPSAAALCPRPTHRVARRSLWRFPPRKKKKKNFFLRGCPLLLRGGYARKGGGRERKREELSPL